MQRVARLLGFASSVSSFGCSFLAVQNPPGDPVERNREAADSCTTSVFYPVMDSLAAGVGAVVIGVAAADDRGKVVWYGAEMEQETAVALGTVQLAAFGAGAVYGFIQTSRCHELREEVEAAEKRGETPGIVGESGWKRPAPADEEGASKGRGE